MYLSYYGLQERPFQPTPDPRFLHLTSAHRETLAQLEYGIDQRKGFLVLTGEVGTGKTTLLRALMHRSDPRTQIALIFHSMLSFDEILEYVIEDIGIESEGTSRTQRLFALNRFLTYQERYGQNTLLIVDEAQNLGDEVLEQIRMLSNFETAQQKLIQILLSGQPELDDRLRRPELRQLRQRIGLRCRTSPMTPAETRDYVLHRLRVARGPGVGADRTLFTDAALEQVSGYARGIPRLVSLVCDHSLLFGYAERRPVVDVDTVREAITYLDDPRPEPADGPAPAETRPVSTSTERPVGAGRTSFSRFLGSLFPGSDAPTRIVRKERRQS